jgi:hypothetical protein
MTDHEMILLRAAVDACPDGFDWWRGSYGRFFIKANDPLDFDGQGETLGEAVSQLLGELGADVPEWPSAERVAELQSTGPGVRLVFDHLRALPLPELLALRGSA